MVRTDLGGKGRLDRLTHPAVWRCRPAPRGLRHAATTRLLDLTGGDVRRGRRFTRHAKLDTVAVYDDARQDFGGQFADLLGDDSAVKPAWIPSPGLDPGARLGIWCKPPRDGRRGGPATRRGKPAFVGTGPVHYVRPGLVPRAR